MELTKAQHHVKGRDAGCLFAFWGFSKVKLTVCFSYVVLRYCALPITSIVHFERRYCACGIFFASSIRLSTSLVLDVQLCGFGAAQTNFFVCSKSGALASLSASRFSLCSCYVRENLGHEKKFEEIFLT